MSYNMPKCRANVSCGTGLVHIRKVVLTTYSDQCELLALSHVLDPQSGGIHVPGLSQLRPVTRAGRSLSAHVGPDAKILAKIQA